MSQNQIDIICKTKFPGNSQVFHLLMNNNSTILELKKKISEITFVTAEMLHLICERKILFDSQSIQSYNLRRNLFVLVVPKLFAGE